MKTQTSFSENTAAATDSRQKPDHEQIADAAYHLYVERGRENGHDLDDWLHAEELLIAAYARDSKEESTSKATKGFTNPVLPFPPEPKHLAQKTQQHEHTRNAATRETIRQQTSAMRSAPRVVASRAERAATANH